MKMYLLHIFFLIVSEMKRLLRTASDKTSLSLGDTTENKRKTILTEIAERYS